MNCLTELTALLIIDEKDTDEIAVEGDMPNGVMKETDIVEDKIERLLFLQVLLWTDTHHIFWHVFLKQMVDYRCIQVNF